MKNGFKFYLCLMLMALNTPVLLAQQATDALIITHQGNVNVVSGKVQEGGNDLLPKGSIILWYGTATNVPKGWAICDGQNGTPDLKERFVVGAGGQFKNGSTGGNKSVTLTEDNLPAHSHGVDLKTKNEPTHNHRISTMDYSKSITKGGGRFVMSAEYSPNLYNYQEIMTTGPGMYDGGESHHINGDTKSIGSGQAFDNLPPYIALYYIMKL